ncbi:hypothetical protein ABFT23_06635 [Nocardioides sp. C4-1]|uniref:hypothetical protein n=1 Tax=Nocardioides sp. C4-1 TaxID=3151851 RepID=UPI003265FDDF
MGTIDQLLVRLSLLLLPPPAERERGDVPGWVMITVMSAGIVAIIGITAREQLNSMLQAAFAKVQ